MDTNQKQPILTNTFGKGMNTDTSDALLGSDQYRLARNLRYTTNTEENTGELHMIDGVKLCDVICGHLDGYTPSKDPVWESDYEIGNIIATTSIRNIGIIIDKRNNTTNTEWRIRKFNKDLSPVIDGEEYTMVTVFGPCSDQIGDNLSLVTRYESDDVIHLYIADGEHTIMSLNINDYYLAGESTIDNIVSTPQIKLHAPKFYGLTYGTLKSGLVQYSYRLYKRYGHSSEISPTTKLILIVNDASGDLSKDKQIKGGEYGKTCNCGVKININGITDDDKIRYDYIIIYRIHYDQAGQNPTIENIADIKLDLFSGTFVDWGHASNEITTLEEYNSHSGIHIIPAVIESKNDYLFAARIKSEINTLESDEFRNYDARAFSFNQYGKCKVQNASEEYTDLTGTEDFSLNIDNLPDITHDCINPRNNMNIDTSILSKDADHADEDADFIYKSANVFGGKGKNISWEFIEGNIIVDSNDKNPYITANTSFSDHGNRQNPYQLGNDNEWWKHYVTTSADEGEDTNYMYGYANPYTSYLMKSLRRNELYRFGIVFYDKYGTPSSVKWIADIRTPDIIQNSPFSRGEHSEYDPFDPAGHSIDDLRAHPLGIKFTVNCPNGAVSYEIVRCNRLASDILNLQQGVLSRPQQKIYRKTDIGVKQDTLTPTGFLTTTNYAISPTGLSNRSINAINSSYDDLRESYSDNITNNNVFQFISAETIYNPESIFQFNSLKLDALKYIYPVQYNTTTETDKDTFGLGLNSFSLYKLHSSDSGIFKNNYGAACVTHSTSTTAAQIDGDRYSCYGIPFVTGSIGSMPGIIGSYYKDSNHNDDWRNLNIDGSYTYGITGSDSKWYEYVNNHYIYQRLYNCALNNEVYCLPHHRNKEYYPEYFDLDDIDNVVYKDVSLMSGWKDYIPVTAILSAKHCDYVIDDIAKANELKWNDLGKDSGSQPSDNLEYVGLITSIGNKSYCNFVSGPLYNSSLTLNDLKRTDSEPKLNDYETLIPIGPAGRCLLLNINKHENEICPVIKIDEISTLPVAISERVNRLLDTVAAKDDVLGPGDVKNNVKIAHTSQNSTDIIRYSLMMGTYICNIKHNVVPYGGNSYIDRQNNIYYSYGDIYDASIGESSTAIVFNGDTFLSPVEYISMHKCYDPNVINTLNACIIQSIPLETSINVAMTYGHEFSRNLTSQAVVNTQIEPANVYGKYIQTDPLYLYNTAYSASSLARIYSIIDYDIYTDSVNNKDYRCYYSAPKGNNELQDSWLKFLPNDYLDVDTRYGAITQLRTFHNSLIYWQENATGLFSVNERTAITDDSNLPLILGTGGILSRYDYIATSNGMSKDDFSDALSESTLYWWDRNRNEICAYAGGQSILSMSKIKGVLNYLNASTAVDEKPCLLYDKKYNEAIMRVTNNGKDESLVYSEYVAAFTSLYNIAFSNKIEFSDITYITKDNNIFKLNTNIADCYASGTNVVIGLQEPILPYLKYVVNENPQIVKTFDNVTFGGRVYGGEVEDVNHLSFTFSTPLKQHSTTESNVITNREYDFKFAIPRNEAREPEESDQQWRSKFEERMKGKTMQCELSSDSNSTDFSLQYITTKFRQSWS